MHAYCYSNYSEKEAIKKDKYDDENVCCYAKRLKNPQLNKKHHYRIVSIQI